MTDRVIKSDEEWKKILTPEQFRVTRRKGTEPSFSGEYYDHKKTGIYECINCGTKLFSSKTKYDSGSGWPSFWDVIDEDKIKYQKDEKLGMTRTEVLCACCGAHLGHIFNDGPQPTGKRYCINSTALDFVNQKD